MKHLIILILLIAVWSKPVHSESPAQIVPFYMFNASATFGVDLALLYAICSVESRCRPNAINKDDANKAGKALGVKEYSYGLFQIKHATARMLGFKGKPHKLLDPTINAFYAAKLLNKLYGKYKHTEKVISAYNAGRYIKHNREYVEKVMKYYLKFKIDRKI